MGARFVSLQIGDRIQATASSFKGLTGHVADIRDDHTLAVDFETKTNVDLGQPGKKGSTSKIVVSCFQLCSSEIRKKFELGDYVHVLQGAHSGDEGYIVQIDGKDATIYKCCFVVSTKYGTHEELSVEVSVAVPQSVSGLELGVDNLP